VARRASRALAGVKKRRDAVFAADLRSRRHRPKRGRARRRAASHTFLVAAVPVEFLFSTASNAMGHVAGRGGFAALPFGQLPAHLRGLTPGGGNWGGRAVRREPRKATNWLGDRLPLEVWPRGGGRVRGYTARKGGASGATSWIPDPVAHWPRPRTGSSPRSRGRGFLSFRGFHARRREGDLLKTPHSCGGAGA